MERESYDQAIAALSKLLRYGPVSSEIQSFSCPFMSFQSRAWWTRSEADHELSLMPGPTYLLIDWRLWFLVDSSEQSNLQGVAAAKIKQITAELETVGSKGFNPYTRIQTGFNLFKTQKYE